MRRSTLEAIVAARLAKRSAVVFMPLFGAPERLCAPDAEDLSPALREGAARALAGDDPVTVETPDGPVFVLPVNPPLRLVVVGAVHVAQPLSSIAALLGYEVTLVDPRTAFARAERWPAGVVVRTEWPDEVLAAMRLDRRTAVAALTHDPKIDDPALACALRSAAFYVGALGSRKTHAARLRRLAEQGLPAEALERIRGPIGLPIGARSPGEIAVAIAAEITESLRRGAAPRPDQGSTKGAP